MKKVIYLLILLVLFIPTFVFAKSDVEIKSIDRIDITSGVEEISEPSFKDLDVEFKLKFLTQGDYVKYNITLVNNSNKDYQVSDDVANFKVSDYIDYSFSFDNNSSVIKANSEKVVSVTILYKKAVNESSLTDGRFIEDNSLSIKLSNGNLSNPNTGRSVLFGLIFLIVIGVLYLVLRDKKKILISVLILSLFLPVVSYAIDLIQININSHIEVDGSCPYRIVTDRGSFVDGEDVKEICVDLIFDDKTYYAFPENLDDTFSSKSEDHPNAVVGINYFMFKDNSYVRVYDADTNELIQEFTKNDSPEYRYSISKNLTIDGYALYYFGNRNIRVDFYDDLLNGGAAIPTLSELFYVKLEDILNSIAGPWIDDEDIIDKIFYLNDSVYDSTGFYISGYNAENGGRIYHVVWNKAPLINSGDIPAISPPSQVVVPSF